MPRESLPLTGHSRPKYSFARAPHEQFGESYFDKLRMVCLKLRPFPLIK